VIGLFLRDKNTVFFFSFFPTEKPVSFVNITFKVPKLQVGRENLSE